MHTYALPDETEPSRFVSTTLMIAQDQLFLHMPQIPFVLITHTSDTTRVAAAVPNHTENTEGLVSTTYSG